MNMDPGTGRSAAPLSRHRSVWEVRSESWIGLVDQLSQLAKLPLDDPSREDRLTTVQALTEALRPIEACWAFPGRRAFTDLCTFIDRGDLALAAVGARRIHRTLASLTYRHEGTAPKNDADLPSQIESEQEYRAQLRCPYFEVLVVDDMPADEEESLHRRVRSERRADDDFVYDVVVVPTFEDALVATMVNFNLQAVVIRYDFPYRSIHFAELTMRRFLEGADVDGELLPESERGPLLGRQIAHLRPELDLYLVTDVNVEDVAAKAGDTFNRIFFGEEDKLELGHSLMQGVAERYHTPFFEALRKYAKQPTGVFHALPLARGKSIMNSNWIGDLGEFYGMNLFMAETSATSGGLDSLLEPTSSLKLAQEYAARAFGSRRTFLVTNGTSTANKIVVQAIVRPDDIVLVDRNCHKSHHYGMVLAGAQVTYLEAYP
ncbi:MAG TPA: ornithine decarboxylase, partial [Accumulibacter sp.]|nr:ornithine decarboxylase [Accumulibacter sp.]